MATDIGLGGCAIGLTDIDQLSRLTKLDFHVGDAVGQFALGRPATLPPRATQNGSVEV